MSVSADIFYLLVYIDDIILISSDSTILQCLIQLMSSEFKLRDLGDVHYFLGIEVQSTSMGRCYDNISILSASLLGLI
jgi:histone deacetylase 1/2